MTESLGRVLNGARVEAQRLGVGYVGTEHLLLGILADSDASTLHLLAPSGITSDQLRIDVETRAERGPLPSTDVIAELPYTARAKAALDCMIDEAARLRASQADTDHLLLGLAAEGQGIAATVLSARGFGIDRLRSLARPPKPSAFDRLSRWLRRV